MKYLSITAALLLSACAVPDGHQRSASLPCSDIHSLSSCERSEATREAVSASETPTETPSTPPSAPPETETPTRPEDQDGCDPCSTDKNWPGNTEGDY